MDNFNLPPPPGFRGLNPHLPVRIYIRNLPHWRQAGATYFVTFRLADALPQQQLQYLKRLRDEWERTHPLPRSEADWEAFAHAETNAVERWSDEGYGDCWFRDIRWIGELTDLLHHFHGRQHQLGCHVIMPNHCHLVIRPFDGHELEDILQGVKSMTARAINRSRGESGSLWQEESYDRIVRDEEHLWRVIQYIGRNPRQAGLAPEQWHRWIDPDWQAAGWNFHDDPP